MNHFSRGNLPESPATQSRHESKLPVAIPASTTPIKARWEFLRSPLFLVVVAAPNFISLAYWGVIASPVYQSETIVVVTNPNKDSDSLTSLLAGNAGASTSGAYILKNRLLSWDEYKSIDQTFHIAKTYKNGDFVARAGGLSSFWRTDDISMWKYYQSKIGINIDEQTGITKIVVSGWNSNDTYGGRRNVGYWEGMTKSSHSQHSRSLRYRPHPDIRASNFEWPLAPAGVDVVEDRPI